jgi:serine/threonine protein kinase
MDVLQTENHFYLVMEYCNCGDLDHLLFKSNSVAPADHYKFLIDMLTAFISLIQQGIIHRDLKPANILVTKPFKERIYKLGDFGFARPLRSYRKEMLDSKVGTPLYMSPQLLDGQPYTSKSDVWSLAYITFQIIYLKSNVLVRR